MPPASLELDGRVADALAAVAAVDGTPPGELAGLIIADWLLTHRPRFVRAVAALDELAGRPAPPHVDVARGALVEDVAAEDVAAEVSDVPPQPDAAPQGEAAHSGKRIVPTTPAPSDPARLPCPADGCDFTARAKPGLAMHVKHKHPGLAPGRRPAVPSPSTPPATAGTCTVCAGVDGTHTTWCATAPRPTTASSAKDDRCIGCGKPASRTVDGEPSCHACWREAGRPAA